MKKVFTLLFLFLSLHGIAQIGGENTFEFIALPQSGRMTAMGGSYISTIDKDLSLALQNPAGLTPLVDRMFTAGTIAFYGKTNYGHFAYAKSFPKIATFSASVQYMSYGKIKKTDEAGNIGATVIPTEWGIQIGAGRQISNHYSIGANLKFMASDLITNQSGGMAVDLAASYLDTTHKFCATLLVRNIGVQFKPYVKGGARESLPFDIQLGISYKPKFLPFRFSLIAHNLFRWNIRYDDPNNIETSTLFADTTQVQKVKKHTFDKIARHFIIGTEVTIAKVLRFNFAFNPMHRGEHAFQNKKSLAGFSFGLGLHIKQFDFSYGVQVFAKGFTAHHFTLNIDFGALMKKKKVTS
jgi:hypothetical protein